MGVRTEAAANRCERLDSRGRIRIRVSTRSQDIVRDMAEGVLKWWLVALNRAEGARFWLLRSKDVGRRKTVVRRSALVGHGADENVPWW